MAARKLNSKGSHIESSLVCVLAAAACVACPGPSTVEKSAEQWVGTITAEGDVTTVVNESGSLWGGPAELVEDLSIGVESGEETHMFGRINGLGASDGRIYVLDGQLDAVRVYDESGAHLFDFGGPGQGPGELDNPVVMGIDPNGRVFVHDLRRINVFDLDGNPLTTWPYRGGLILPVVVTVDGVAFFPWSWSDAGQRLSGLVGIGPEGDERRHVPIPRTELADWADWGLEARRPDGSLITSTAVPYAPRNAWALLPSGATAEAVPDRYRFEVRRPDGGRLVVERTAETVPVVPEEADWLRRRVTARMRSSLPGWTWTANPIPGHKPPITQFFGDRHGRVWVLRIQRTMSNPGCDADPTRVENRSPASCWRDVMALDVFDERTGHYLGEVGLDLPEAYRPWPVFLEGAILAVVEDESGTVMVKRYRLILPAPERP